MPTTVAFQIVPPSRGTVVSVGGLKLATTVEPGLPPLSFRIRKFHEGAGEVVTLERTRSTEVRVQDWSRMVNGMAKLN